MCLLALAYKVVPQYPVLLAANRDEFHDRPGLPPRPLAEGIWGGQDPRGGGTWLGVTAAGRVVGLTNLTPPHNVQPHARSRGLLCLDALALPRADALGPFLARAVQRDAYNEFNLLAADGLDACVASYVGGRLSVTPLPAGVHVIANRLPDDATDLKVARARQLIDPPADIDGAIAHLQSVCRDHGLRDDRADALCVHGDAHGTLSSSIIALGDRPASRRYLFAAGEPCLCEYQDMSRLIQAAKVVGHRS